MHMSLVLMHRFTKFIKEQVWRVVWPCAAMTLLL